nr:venom polypeptide precursor [Doratifera vulnerans]
MYLLLLCLVLSTSYASVPVDMPLEEYIKMLPYYTQCIAESAVDPSILTILRHNRYVPVSESFKKFVSCLLRVSGYGDENGKFIVSKILTLFPENVRSEELKKALEECNNKSNGSNTEETSMEVYQCYIDTSPVRITIPGSSLISSISSLPLSLL